MPTHHHAGPMVRPDPSVAMAPISVAAILLAAILSVLWLAGGASRADATGQVIVRVGAWIVVIALVLAGDRAGDRPALRRARAPAFLLLTAVLLVVLQLVPLPPAVWQTLPGRAFMTEAALASGQAQPWRPWSIVPAATLNAAGSLIIPVCVLLLVVSLKTRERSWLPGMLLGLVTAATLVGLLQFSGAGFNNPFVNDTPGEVSGTFANRNHFALFLAIGCLLAPVWAFPDSRSLGWRGPIALALVLLFALTILATGSRAGMILGVLALGMGLLLARRGLRRTLRRAPKWAFPAVIATIVGALAIFVLLSIASNRAESINRAITLSTDDDMRTRGLPTVLAMIETYFPAGTGFGSFDPLFRMHEPFHLLKFTYFNHAHNDFLEIVLDGGLPALVLLIVAAGWWAFASIRAWRAQADPAHAPEQMLPKLGSAILLLVFLASVFDYPARTPMIMAMIIIAGWWLAQGAEVPHRSSLPKPEQHL